MFRTIVRIQMLVFLLPLVVVGGAVALVVTGQPALSDARESVDARWAELRGPLRERYLKLDAARQAFAASGGADRDVVRDLDSTLRRWNELVAASPHDADEAAEAELANRLEAAGARLVANVNVDRFRGNAAVTTPLAAFQSAGPTPELRQAYNRAVRRYEDDRNQLLRRPVALAFGFDPRSLFLLP